MGVKTSVFGSVTLTNEEAEKFVRQVKYGRPKKNAAKLLREGRTLLKKFEEQGDVMLYPRKDTQK